jgi:hypothetical protein
MKRNSVKINYRLAVHAEEVVPKFLNNIAECQFHPGREKSSAKLVNLTK